MDTDDWAGLPDYAAPVRDWPVDSKGNRLSMHVPDPDDGGCLWCRDVQFPCAELRNSTHRAD